MEATPESERTTDRPSRLENWRRWWLAGTVLDWGFCVLSVGLVAAGYYESYLTRTFMPAPKWAAVPVQVAWFAVTAYLAVAAFLAWRRDGRLRSVIPDGYGLSVAGCAIFVVGILINGWWSDAFGPDYGVPAIFRLPNLLEIAGAGLIVVGPLRASAGRGELMAGPTAVFSAVLLLATVTFFTQFDHPYIDQYAVRGAVPLPPFGSRFDLAYHREEILGALGLMMQTGAVVGVVLWILRQSRLPAGSLTVMLSVTAFLAATQLGEYSIVIVGVISGVLADVALALTRPRADRVLSLHLFAVVLGAILSATYLVFIGLNPGTWWPPDMTYGTVFACAIVGGLISYGLFPGADAVRAASVLWPALSPESSSEAPDVTVERVEHALKVLHSTRDLADNPLIGMRCIAASTPRVVDRLRELEESAAPA